MTTGKMRRVLVSAAAAVLGTLLFGMPAQAAPVTFQFTVTVDKVEDDPADSLFGGVQKGDKVQSYFTYDTASPDLEPGATDFGYYQMFGGVAKFGLLTPRPFESNEFWVNVTDGLFGIDTLTVQGWAPLNAPGFDDFGWMNFVVRDSSGTWLNSDAPPSNLSAAQIAGFDTWLSFQGTKSDAKYTLIGHVSFDGPTPDPTPAVPEPASLVLLGTGLLGALKLRRLRR